MRQPLVVVDESAPQPRVLMGRRRPDLAFMPNKFVFPGGRVDKGGPDYGERRRAGSSTKIGKKLLKDMKEARVSTIARARAIALAALRDSVRGGRPPWWELTASSAWARPKGTYEWRVGRLLRNGGRLPRASPRCRLLCPSHHASGPSEALRYAFLHGSSASAVDDLTVGKIAYNI